MTNEQKSRIKELRKAGFSYGKISEFLDIPKNTIKTYCNRNNLPSTSISQNNAADYCKECGALIVQTEKRKPRVFCSSDCRKKWWKEHPEHINRRSARECTCIGCGKSFHAYKKSNRKYCSHSCYIKSRFGGDTDA